MDEIVSKNGGLHVTLSYVPSNIRVEEQAFGRTGRKGATGSARFIVLDQAARPIEKLKKERDVAEAARLTSIRKTTMRSMDVEAYLLEGSEAGSRDPGGEFGGLKGLYKELNELLKPKLKTLPSLMRERYRQIQLGSVLDSWAIWLEKDITITADDGTVIDKMEARRKFEKFRADMMHRFHAEKEGDITRMVAGPTALLKLGRLFRTVMQAATVQASHLHNHIPIHIYRHTAI